MRRRFGFIGVAGVLFSAGVIHAQGTVCDSPCVIMRLPLLKRNDMPVPNSNPLAELQGKVSGANIIGQGSLRDYPERDVTKPAVAINNGVAPQYPDAMLERRYSGAVTTVFVVDIDGLVDTATFNVLSTSGEEFTNAVREVVPQLRYVPAELVGKKVRQVVRRTFEFNYRAAVPCESPCPFMNLPLLIPPAGTTQQKLPFIVKQFSMDIAVPVKALYEYQVDKAAKPARGSVSPVYPDSLKKAKVDGEVVASFIVDTLGRVDIESIQILKSTHQLFAMSLLEALPRMKFLPAELHGVKVRQVVQQPFIFHTKQ